MRVVEHDRITATRFRSKRERRWRVDCRDRARAVRLTRMTQRPLVAAVPAAR